VGGLSPPARCAVSVSEPVVSAETTRILTPSETVFAETTRVGITALEMEKLPLVCLKCTTNA